MNKKILFTIFLMFLITCTAISGVEAASNNNINIFSDFSSWINSLFSTKKASITYNQPSISEQYNAPDISNSEHSIYNKKVSELSNEEPSSVSNQYIVVSPDYGYVGDTVELKGYGFKPFEQDIIIRFDDQFMGTTSASITGKFTFDLEVPMPTNDEVFYLVEAVDSDGYIVYDKFTILWNQPQYPVITVNPDEGYVGDIVELSGKGFKANEEGIIIRFDDIFIGTTNANDEGEFVWLLEIPMPNDDELFYLVEAVDSDGFIVYDTFTILWVEELTLIANPTEGVVDQIIGLEGTGYRPGDHLDIYMMGLENYSETTLIAEVVASNAGNFDTIFIVPNLALGTHNILVFGDNMVSLYDVVEEFTIIENGTQPELTLIATPDEGVVSQVIDLEGTGYIPNTELAIFLNPANPEIIATPMTDANGDFTTTFVVPDLTPDMYIMNVFNLETSIIYNVYEEFTIIENGTQPELTLIATPDEGYVGDVIDLEGTGYIPGDNLIILFDNEIIVTSSMGASGSFDTTFVVPDLAPGDYNINVYGTNMSSMYNVYEVFTILDNGTQPDYPSITLSAPGGHVGETRTVYGHDFLYVSSNETITIRMAGIIIAEFQWSDAEFEVDFVVPDLAPGNNYLVSVDNYPTAYAYFDVLEGPYFSELYVNPEQGYVGDVINIWGNDYPANDTLIIMMAGQVIATPTTDANGTFIDTFNVPNVPTGDYEITVVNRAGTADFEVLENVGPDESEIFVDPVSGYEGDVINVWGNNFNPNETVTLYLGANFIVNVNTDNTGSFTGVFTVPDVAAGLYNVMAVGYSATTPFLVLEQGGVEPDLFVSPTSGIPGDIIDLSGINFGANETLVIYLDSQIIATPTTDVNGAFLTTFVVPEWAADDYEITVFGYSVSEWFTINDWAEEEEEEEDDDYDDDWNDDIEREQHQYYMEGLTCSADVNVGEQAVLSLEVVNRGITDEDNMIVEVTCNDLGINIIMEDVLIERLEPNYMEIPLNIPANAEAGSYSCMVEIYSDYYVYEQVDRVLDSINIIVGQPVEYTGTEVIYMDAMEEEQESPDLNVSLFLLNIALLVIILVFVVLIIRSIRK